MLPSSSEDVGVARWFLNTSKSSLPRRRSSFEQHRIFSSSTRRVTRMNRCQSLNQRVPRTRSRTRTRTAVCRARHPSPGGVGRSSGPGCIHTKSILNPDVPKIIHSTPIFARSTRFVSSLNIPQRFVSKRQQERSFHPPLPPRARRRPGRRPVVGVGVVGAHAAPRLATTTIAPVVPPPVVGVGVGGITRRRRRRRLDGWMDRSTDDDDGGAFGPFPSARRRPSTAPLRSVPPGRGRRPRLRPSARASFREDEEGRYFHRLLQRREARADGRTNARALGLHTRAKGAPSVRTLFRAKSNGALTQLSTRRVPAR